LITLEQQMQIILGKGKELSFREIGRINGCDPRTAKKYKERPELLGKPRQTAPRPSLLGGMRSPWNACAYIPDLD